MRRIIAATVAALAVVALAAGSAVGAPTATITFDLNTTTCQLTIRSTKDISNFTVNGVKTEDVNATSITIQVAEGDVVTVKSGTSTATFTVVGCTHRPEDPHDPHDGHDGPDHDGDGDHDADDHH